MPFPQTQTAKYNQFNSQKDAVIEKSGIIELDDSHSKSKQDKSKLLLKAVPWPLVNNQRLKLRTLENSNMKSKGQDGIPLIDLESKDVEGIKEEIKVSYSPKHVSFKSKFQNISS